MIDLFVNESYFIVDFLTYFSQKNGAIFQLIIINTLFWVVHGHFNLRMITSQIKRCKNCT
jgi:hypothetical protein